uniref:Putative trypsin-like protein n=1 Tax=Lutzomyia longipalpis TaxID=7200 RepID=A0A1B0GJG9_LUTLO
MLSLRVIVLFAVALAESSLAKEERLPHKISVGSSMSINCIGTVLSKNTVLIPASCGVGYSGMEVRVRPTDTPINDSGDMYYINRIVHHPDRDYMDMSKEQTITTLDRNIDGGKGFKAAKVAKDDVTIPAGEVVTTIRRSPKSSPLPSYYWADLEYYNIKVIDDAKCKEIHGDRWSSDFICLSAINPNADYPNNICQ